VRRALMLHEGYIGRCDPLRRKARRWPIGMAGSSAWSAARPPTCRSACW
jgi:hypothetical protein